MELLRDGVAHAALATDHAERHHVAYVAELERFAAVVAGDEPRRGPLAPGGDDAVAALRLALLARRSAATGTPQVRAAIPA